MLSIVNLMEILQKLNRQRGIERVPSCCLTLTLITPFLIGPIFNLAYFCVYCGNVFEVMGGSWSMVGSNASIKTIDFHFYTHMLFIR